MHKFDSLAIDLAGHNLIEASAGTGKTYAIACLYLRLVAEFGLTPEEILVVTFTEAATKELRGRIRERLREARDVVAGAATKDDFLKAFATEGRKGWPGMEIALARLEVALNGFDGAAISTIHGFCSRAIQENVFESGSLYDTELVTDPRPFIEECVNDFWRRTFFGDDALLLTAAMQRGWSPAELVRFLKGKLGNPDIIVEPLFSTGQEMELAAACAEAYLSLTSLWRDKEGEIAAIITGDQGLSRSQKNYHPDLVSGLLAGMADYVAGGNPFDFCADFDKFTTGFIRGQTLKKHEPPIHPFFDSCEKMKELAARRLVALKGSLFQFARKRLVELKNERNIRFFDDLLVVLDRALGGTSGEDLARSLRERYKAALIDEFQDTDPVQYRIFHQIYSGKEAPLFLIGDPKQAIYSFRGADIFAYLEAKEDMPQAQRFTMDRNWRSTPEMVEGVNRLFQQKESLPFLFDALAFPQVSAAKNERPLSLVGRDPSPLQVWFMGRDGNDGKFIPLGKARQRIVAAVAGEISGLLADGRDGKATIDGRGVLPEDIAVVVRSHKEAALIQNALAGLRIPSVVQSNESLFATREARDLFRVMEALAEPGSETSVRTALVTSVFGATGNDIALLLDEEGKWEERLASFRDYHDIWRGSGFMTMFRTLLSREKVRERLLSLEDGERRLTNLLHCCEVIHGAATEGKLSIDPLCAWFGERVSVPPESEEFQIRLESDEKTVRIVTIHVSKGLEYPIVFCPFTWGGIIDDDETATCHEEYRMVVDIGSEEFERRRQAARRETLAENIRLLYVALTRARFRSYLVWGRFRYTETSAPAYLLHGPDADEKGEIVALLEAAMKDIPDSKLLEKLRSLEKEGESCLAVTQDPVSSQVPYLQKIDETEAPFCRFFGGEIETEWRVASFTSFVTRHRREEELPDRDLALAVDNESGVPAEEAPIPGSIFAFPRGAGAGIFLHSLLERLNFAMTIEEEVNDLVLRELVRYGYGVEWFDAVITMLRNVLQAPLSDGGRNFSLSDLKPGNWQSELEFFFPLRFIESRDVAKVLQRWGAVHSGVPLAEVAGRLDFCRVAGMVRGFIDLVFRHDGKFFIIDWKSNHLGNRSDEYSQKRLFREMERNLYPLQYLLYTVAFNRHLERCVPGYRYASHFGGVRYLFLRGLDPGQPKTGVFSDLPPAGLIEELASCLIECEGAGR